MNKIMRVHRHPLRFLLSLSFVLLAGLWVAGCDAGSVEEPQVGIPVEGDPNCTPACFFKDCGSDGCGGVCGVCAAGEGCSSGRCVVGAVDDDAGSTGQDGAHNAAA